VDILNIRGALELDVEMMLNCPARTGDDNVVAAMVGVVAKYWPGNSYGRSTSKRDLATIVDDVLLRDLR
jgi:hypothetical protein